MDEKLPRGTRVRLGPDPYCVIGSNSVRDRQDQLATLVGLIDVRPGDVVEILSGPDHVGDYWVTNPRRGDDRDSVPVNGACFLEDTITDDEMAEALASIAKAVQPFVQTPTKHCRTCTCQEDA